MKREEASEIINGYFFYTVLPRCNGKVVNSRKLEEAIKMALEALKQPERNKGKWEWDAEEGYWCSECKEYVYGCTEEIMEGSYKFCPFCGSENEENQWTEGKE